MEEERELKRREYLKAKKIEALQAIKPICEYFKIDYDYVVKEKGQTETLILNGQEIGCSANSVSAVIDEIIGYIFIKIYCRNRYLPFETQIKNKIKEYWLN